MNDIEYAYRRLIEEAEAHFAAQVRWSFDHRLIVDEAGPLPFAAQWLRELQAVRNAELLERASQRTMHA